MDNFDVRHNIETESIHRIADCFLRHPLQVNGVLEADAEIIRLPGENESYLVVKTDGIHEEIKEQLYSDPYMIGWMAVTAPISDIAAVGAIPTGILLSVILPKHENSLWLDSFIKGVNAACEHYNVFVLGGDTNYDSFFSVNTSVVASINQQNPRLRSNIKSGDYLYATATLGVGNAFAYSRFFDPSFAINYKPLARLNESEFIVEYATSCIDTSDGFFPALAVLSEINQVGFDIENSLKNILSVDALQIVEIANIPDWFLLAGPHGEYELLFNIPEAKYLSFQQHCLEIDFHPVYLGRATDEYQLKFTTGTSPVQCAPAQIPNLFYDADGNVQRYFELLMQQHYKWIK